MFAAELPSCAGVAFSVLPLIFLVTLSFRTKVRATRSATCARALARMNAFLQENLTGMATVQHLEPRGAQLRGVPRASTPSTATPTSQAIFYYAIFFPLLELVGALAVALIVWYGGRQVMWDRAHAGRAGRVHPVRAALLPAHLGPEREVQHPAVRRWPRRSASSTCSTRRSTAAAARERPRRVEPASAGDIEFDGVHFAYQRARTGAEGRLVPRRARREGGASSAPPARARRRSSRC